MISHKYKCIFIHIPRCGGTSIEMALCGQDWHTVDKTTKHLIGSTAKKIYEPYWDNYFKFSFVRNPWARTASLQKFSHFYGVSIQKGKVNFGKYFDKFYPLEIDRRSKSHKDSFKPIENAIYLNTLNVKLDFIGRFENLQQDFNTVCDQLGIPHQQLPHSEKSFKKNYNKHYTEYYDDETREIVAEKYARDIEYFGYKFGE